LDQIAARFGTAFFIDPRQERRMPENDSTGIAINLG
jgi:hypothetical protein